MNIRHYNYVNGYDNDVKSYGLSEECLEFINDVRKAMYPVDTYSQVLFDHETGSFYVHTTLDINSVVGPYDKKVYTPIVASTRIVWKVYLKLVAIDELDVDVRRRQTISVETEFDKFNVLIHPTWYNELHHLTNFTSYVIGDPIPRIETIKDLIFAIHENVVAEVKDGKKLSDSMEEQLAKINENKE